MIDELLPEQPGGYRYSNSDPVTGQAAWYDVRVRMEKAEPNEQRTTEPQFADLSPKVGLSERPGTLRYGAGFRRAREDEA